MREWLSEVTPTLGPLGRWLRRLFKLDRRYLVRFHGGHERSGFVTSGHAHGWASDRGFTEREYVVCYYDPAVDMRLPGFSHPSRDSFKP